MKISQLARTTGLSDRTIRYYEAIGVLPQPKRLANGYRVYAESDVDRLKFVIGLRRLDFSLDDIQEILAMRDRHEGSCRVVLELLSVKAEQVSQRINELQLLEDELHRLYQAGLTYPLDDVDGKDCICHLVTERDRSS
ncbi:MAG: heavy metal-responsive transcriptional regulator [Anaerolineales bacterium]|nr:heavy metal-responsive transcriptional regulator [Anaerolineales bacterium]